jgi:hypothetical protein
MSAPIVSIRLDEQQINALTAAAKAAGRTRSAHAAHLVQAGLSGAPVAAARTGEHSLSASVEAMFAAVEGIDVDAQLESARVVLASSCLAVVTSSRRPPMRTITPGCVRSSLSMASTRSTTCALAAL